MCLWMSAMTLLCLEPARRERSPCDLGRRKEATVSLDLSVRVLENEGVRRRNWQGNAAVSENEGGFAEPARGKE